MHQTPVSQVQAGVSSRIQWADALRGIAILLVILLHVPVMSAKMGLVVPEWVERWQWSLQPYRMPSLLFLSGMLLRASLAKGPRRYTVGKLQGILWPYVVWTIITAFALREPAELMSPKA